MELTEAPSVLITGCGYVGTRLAKTLQESGCSVEAMVRTDTSALHLRDIGIPTLVRDLDEIGHVTLQEKYDVIYYLVPPQRTGIRDERIRGFLASITQSPDRIILFSTTGVYGDCKGEWVDEACKPSPVADRARRRLDAENYLREWCERNGVEYTILRIPGIYGPGKLPLQRVKDAKPVLSREESPWSNRVYIDDLIRVCVASLSKKAGNQIFNVSDGHPSTMTDYFLAVADVFGYAEPEQISLQQAQESFSSEMMSYLTESRRISNRKLLDMLDVHMEYEDLARGLKQCKDESTR